jgi:hypothetical protein
LLVLHVVAGRQKTIDLERGAVPLDRRDVLGDFQQDREILKRLAAPTEPVG